MNETSFSRIIKTRRLEMGISLKELASTVGMAPSYLHRLEIGQRTNPSVKVVYAISEILKLDFLLLAEKIMEEDVVNRKYIEEQE